MTTPAVAQNTNQAQQSQEQQVRRSGLEGQMAPIQEAYQRDLIDISRGFPMPEGYSDASKLNQNEKALLAQAKKGKVSMKDLADNGHHKIIRSLAGKWMNGKRVSQARHQMAADILTTIPVDQVEMLAKGQKIPKAIQSQKFHGYQRNHRDTQKIPTDRDDNRRTIGNRPTDNVWDKALVKMAKAELVSRQGHINGAQELRDRRVNNVLAQEQKKTQQAQNTSADIITPTTTNSPANAGIITPTTTNSPANAGIITPTTTNSPAAKPDYRPTNTAKADAAGVILNGSKILKKGLEGPEVEVLSGFLKEHGYDTGTPANKYGPATETAVVRIQEKIKAKLIEKAGDDPILKAQAEEFLIDGRFGPQTAMYSREFLGLKNYLETGSIEASTVPEPEPRAPVETPVETQPAPQPEPEAPIRIQTDNQMVEEALTLLESNMPLPLAQHRIRSIPSDKITEINDSLAKLNEEQLEEVKRSYKGRDGATLAADIEQRNEKTDNLNELEARLAGKGVEADAMALKKSIVRIGTDLPRIKKILSTRTSEQVDQIVEEYNKIDKNGIWRGKGKELFPALKSDLSGQDWEDVKSLLAKNNAFQKYIESIGETVSSEAEAETERKVGTRASTRENRGGRGTQPTAAEVESIVAEEQEETQTTIEAVNWIEKTLISENLENTKQLTKAIRETEAIHVKTLAEAYEMKTGKNLLSELEALKAKHEGSEHYGFYANPAEEFAKKIGS